MRVFRFLVLALFVVVSGIYSYFYFYNRITEDLSWPEISFANPVLEVSVHADSAALLQDVTARDEKDGDLSKRVIVEKISNFVEKGLSNITYAVVDGDNHVVKATRRLRYADYRSPRFTFTQAMRFNVGSSFNVLKVLGAADMIDGDISNKIKLTSSDLVVNAPGTYLMQAQVANSKGDVSYLRFHVTMAEAVRGAPQIELKAYLLYLDRGSAFDPAAWFASVSRNDQPVEGYELDIASDVDPLRPGQYRVDYRVTEKSGMTTETSLVVIVEE